MFTIIFSVLFAIFAALVFVGYKVFKKAFAKVSSADVERALENAQNIVASRKASK